MNFRRLLKMLETETDKEKIAEVMQKINSEITKRCCPDGQLWLYEALGNRITHM